MSIRHADPESGPVTRAEWDAAHEIESASVPVSAINATGMASATTYLRGDGAWAAGPTGATGPTGPQGSQGPAGPRAVLWRLEGPDPNEAPFFRVYANGDAFTTVNNQPSYAWSANGGQVSGAYVSAPANFVVGDINSEIAFRGGPSITYPNGLIAGAFVVFTADKNNTISSGFRVKVLDPAWSVDFSFGASAEYPIDGDMALGTDGSVWLYADPDWLLLKAGA